MVTNGVAEKVPVYISEQLKLSECDVPAHEVTWQRVSMASDRWLCVRHGLKHRRRSSKAVHRKREQVVTIAQLGYGGRRKPEDSFGSIKRLKIQCNSAQMNPSRALLCVLSHRKFLVYDLDVHNHPIVNSYNAEDHVVFWNWLSKTQIGFVIPRGVFIWQAFTKAEPTEISSFDFTGIGSVGSQRSMEDDCFFSPRLANSSVSDDAATGDQARFLCSLDSRLYGKQIVQLKSDAALNWIALTALFEEDDSDNAVSQQRDDAQKLPRRCSSSESSGTAQADDTLARFDSLTAQQRRRNFAEQSKEKHLRAAPVCGIVQLHSVADRVTQCIVDAHCVQFSSHRFAWNASPSTVLLLVTRGARSSSGKLHVMELQPLATGNLAPTQHCDTLSLTTADLGLGKAVASQFDIAVSIICSTPSILESPSTVLVTNGCHESRPGSTVSPSLAALSTSLPPSGLAKRSSFSGIATIMQQSSIERPLLSAHFASRSFARKSECQNDSLVDLREAEPVLVAIPGPPRSPASLGRRRGLLLQATANQQRRSALVIQPPVETSVTCDNADERRCSDPPPPPPRRFREPQSPQSGVPPSTTSCLDKYGLIYVVTKYGRVHVCDAETATLLFCLRIADVGDVVFAATVNQTTQGLLCVTRSGRVLSVDLKDQKIVAYFMTACRNKLGIADRVARQLAAYDRSAITEILITNR